MPEKVIKYMKKKIKYRQKRRKPLVMREEAVMTLEGHQGIMNNNLKEVKKDYGIFFTPERIVDFMVNLIEPSRYVDKRDIAILGSACGLRSLPAKPIMDEIDVCLAHIYNFNEDTLDFIINYDIKYCMDKEVDSEEKDSND